jgi:fermentation-respiration switch protein FrsA (DUF1100 family)
MSIQRRTFLTLGAATGVGLSLAGAGQALGHRPALQTPTPRDPAPAEPFAIGLREFAWSRGDRELKTLIYYPTTGEPGDEPIWDAPVADGVFPICQYSHGLNSKPENATEVIPPLASAGFVVPAPYFPTTSEGAEGNIDDVYNGNQSMDVSEVLTQTIALNDSDDPLAGHLDASMGVGVCGHSLGGMTTHGLLSAWPDDRIVAASPMATVDMGDPDGTVTANVLFIHGDQDTTCPYDEARQAYEELPATKAFLTFLGQGHSLVGEGSSGEPGPLWFDDERCRNTLVDWMRWSLYGDTAARDRLPEDATSDDTIWEFIQE